MAIKKKTTAKKKKTTAKEEDGQEEDGQEEDGQEEDGQEEDGQEEDGQEEDGQEEDGQEKKIRFSAGEASSPAVPFSLNIYSVLKKKSIQLCNLLILWLLQVKQWP
jgi:hypothetical protein